MSNFRCGNHILPDAIGMTLIIIPEMSFTMCLLAEKRRLEAAIELILTLSSE